MNAVQEVGRNGEDEAADFLKRKGYKILLRNWKAPRWGEIDIIAVDKGVLVFVEVKTRTDNYLGGPLSAVNYYKLRTLVRTAGFFKQSFPDTPDLLRMDVVSVTLGETTSITHIENIYEDKIG